MTRLVSVIIVHHRRADMTRRLVGIFGGLAETCAMEIILVAIGSGEPIDPGDMPFPVRLVRLEENRGYGAACNAGAAAAVGDVLLITNNDIEFSGDAVTPLLDALSGDPSIAAVAPRMYFPDGRLQLSYSDDPSLWNSWKERHRQRQCRKGRGFLYGRRVRDAATSRDVDWITGAFFAIRMDAFQHVGGFDEQYFLYFEDADLCRRLRNHGLRIRYQPASVVVHYGGASQTSEERHIPAHWMGQLRYFASHRSRISFFLLKFYLTAKFFWTAYRTPEEKVPIRETLASIRQYPYRTMPVHHDATTPLHA